MLTEQKVKELQRRYSDENVCHPLDERWTIVALCHAWLSAQPSAFCQCGDANKIGVLHRNDGQPCVGVSLLDPLGTGSVRYVCKCGGGKECGCGGTK